jgi:DNA-binding MarR family transcriptional regulator
MKFKIDTFNGILVYIAINQKMSKDGVLGKLPISQLIKYSSIAGAESTHYHIKQLADDGYITVERNENGIITHILDVTRKGHDYYHSPTLAKW